MSIAYISDPMICISQNIWISFLSSAVNAMLTLATLLLFA